MGSSLLREASVSALSLQLIPPTTTPGLSPRLRPRPNPRLIPGASVRLQGLEEAGRHDASEPASTLSGVGGESGLSNGGRHRDLQSLVEDERDGGSSMPSKRTLWRNCDGKKKSLDYFWIYIKCKRFFPTKQMDF